MRLCVWSHGSVSGVALAICLTVALCGIRAPAAAAELVMFRSSICEWCEAWESEVGAIYPKTAEGRRVPLRRVDIDLPRPPDLVGVDPVVFSPTFVLLEDGREVGRILGYPGDAHFWGLFGMLLRNLKAP